MGLLYKTKSYLIGGMERTDGRGWRNEIAQKLAPLGIICFDPYKKPFTIDVEESGKVAEEIKELIEKEDYDEVARRFKLIRSFDLSMVDRCDFIIAYIDPNVVTVGTWEEFFWSNRQKKPIFLIVEGGKKKTAWWLFGTIPHKYIYDNIDDVVSVLTKIDAGEKELDNDRWKLLKTEYR